MPTVVKVGAAGAAAVLLVVGASALVPVGVGAAAFGGWQLYRGRCRMTPERRRVYAQAIWTLKDPKKLRALADEFEKAGCKKEAEHLRKRAALRERSPEEQKAERSRYRRAMAYTDLRAVEAEAARFESTGADGAAKNLRTRAEALRAVLR